MQEDITRRTVAITITASKLTGRVLAAAFQKVLRDMERQRRAALTPHGKQSVKKLLGHGGGANSIPLKGSARRFDAVARKWGVDYAVHKVGPKDHLLFFKAGQADAVTAAFSEYTKRTLKREGGRASILGQLRVLREKARAHRQERAQEKEVARDGR